MKTLFLILGLLFSIQSTKSQTVDIVNDCEKIVLKSSETFDGIVSSLVFVISWPIEAPLQIEPSFPFMSIQKSGPEFIKNGRGHQIFSWIGFSQLKEEGFEMNESGIEIMKVLNEGFRLESGDSEKNSEYYVALNGQPSTGRMISVECQANSSVFVFPNPTREELNIRILKGKYNRISLISSIGSIVYSSRIQSETTKIDVRNLADGQYTVVLEGVGKWRYTTKIMIEK